MAERTKLIERFRKHLEERGWPRVVLFVIVALSGFAGFLVSFAFLSAGMSSMAWRYGLAGGSAYVTFLCLLALYVGWKRRLGELDAGDALEAAQWIDVPVPRGGGPGPASYFSGGRSGGAGASSSWAPVSSASSSPGSSGSVGGSWFDDADAGWVLLALVALFAGAIAVGYVVWVAPALLAEVFVDALIVGTVSKQMGLTERRDWTATVLRRTWVPATVMVLTLTIAGWALQQAVPEARSIGPAVQALALR
jgi:hypothetical protein